MKKELEANDMMTLKRVANPAHKENENVGVNFR
jgi:hypothetical protein